MSSQVFGASLFFLLFCTFTMPMGSSMVNVYGARQAITFSRTPNGYNNQSGAFKLSGQLTDDAGNGEVCVMYDYFIFNTQGGQELQGSLQASGTVGWIYYMILSSPYQLYGFENSNCGVGYWEQIAPASAINWTAPKDGQYALVFVTNGFSSATMYFTQ
ncbi:MAG: hypothetical protein ABSA92_12490 [Candidatus Bathyarchaeia archaeon]|jgi:hypothetical protein